MIDSRVKNWINESIEKTLAQADITYLLELEMDWFTPLNFSERMVKVIEGLNYFESIVRNLPSNEQSFIESKQFRFDGRIELCSERGKIGEIQMPKSVDELEVGLEKIQPPRLFLSRDTGCWYVQDMEFYYKRIDFLESDLLKNVKATYVQTLPFSEDLGRYTWRSIVFEDGQTNFCSESIVDSFWDSSKYDIVESISNLMLEFNPKISDGCCLVITKEYFNVRFVEIIDRFSRFIDLVFDIANYDIDYIYPFHIEIDYDSSIVSKNLIPGLKFNMSDFVQSFENISCIKIKLHDHCNKFSNLVEYYYLPCGRIFTSKTKVRVVLAQEKREHDTNYRLCLKIYRKDD